MSLFRTPAVAEFQRAKAESVAWRGRLASAGVWSLMGAVLVYGVMYEAPTRPELHGETVFSPVRRAVYAAIDRALLRGAGAGGVAGAGAGGAGAGAGAGAADKAGAARAPSASAASAEAARAPAAASSPASAAGASSSALR